MAEESDHAESKQPHRINSTVLAIVLLLVNSVAGISPTQPTATCYDNSTKCSSWAQSYACSGHYELPGVGSVLLSDYCCASCGGATLAPTSAPTPSPLFTCTAEDDFSEGILYLGTNGITELTNTTLQACSGSWTKQVELIDFHTNGWGTVQSIAPGAFMTLPALGFTGVISITLSMNQLTTIKADTFRGIMKCNAECIPPSISLTPNTIIIYGISPPPTLLPRFAVK